MSTLSNKHVYEAELGPESDLKSFFHSSMLVTRTEFFRKNILYQDLENDVLPSLFKSGEQHINNFRLWSAGCSDGREPYSLGMIINNWLNENKIHIPIHIFASDINSDQISIGKKGEYAINNNELKKLNRFHEYFKQLDCKTVVIDPNLFRKVSFSNEDIIARQSNKKYNIIVCTNVLLYYEKEYRKKIVNSLARSLKSGGFLYVETVGDMYFKQIGFTRIKPGSNFFRKVDTREID